jgi:triosephosphate isomerase
MNMTAAEAAAYAGALQGFQAPSIDLFVLPPFTSLHAAKAALAGTDVAIGGQNMHWDANGAWTGEISAPMLAEAGCAYVELAHSERLMHFGETYELVRRKVDSAFAHGLVPILCLGELADEKPRADEILRAQLLASMAGQGSANAARVLYAYEPRWAIGAPDAAPPAYVAERHRAIRLILAERFGADVAASARVLYGGSVNARNGPELVALEDVDGLFVGRAAWTPEGFKAIAKIVEEAAAKKERP